MRANHLDAMQNVAMRRQTLIALALLGGAARASTFVLVALYLQQALHMAPRLAGLAMVLLTAPLARCDQKLLSNAFQ